MAEREITAEEIAQALGDYCDHHDVQPEDVIVDMMVRTGGPHGDRPVTVGFRLSLDVDGRSKGCDERFGAWGK